MAFKSTEARAGLIAVTLVAASFGCGQGAKSSSQGTSRAPIRSAPPVTITPRTTPPVTSPVASATPITPPVVTSPPTTTPPVVVPPVTPPPLPPAAPPSFEFDIDAPGWTGGTVFVACDLPVNGKGAWTADAFALQMDPKLNTRWHGVMTVTSGTAAITSGTTITFKVTRGGWSTVEKDPHGDEVPNRVAVCGNGPTKVFAHVFHWADDTILPPKASIRDLGYFVPRALQGPKRQVLAHLPPGYDDPQNAGRRYPVLYALEGQTMFDPSRSPTGQTVGLDAAADVNSANGHASVIVVTIDSTFQKFQEYGPTFDPVLGVGGRLEDLGSWLFDELKPEIDRLYRTKAGAETTGLLGTGLSGLAAFRLAWNHADKVKLVAALSPEMTWNQDETKGYVTKVTTKPALRVWLDTGTNDGAAPQARLQSVRDVQAAMVGVGFTLGGDLRYTEVLGGTLDETSWAARIADVLAYLFP